MDIYTENCFYGKCDRTGEIKYISQNDLKPFNRFSQNNNLIQGIIDLGGEDITEFIEDVIHLGFAVAKPIVLKHFDSDSKFFISGSRIDNNLSICISNKPNTGENKIYDELLQLNNELTNKIRSMSKSLDKQRSRDADRVFYEDLTKLNNELISTQRDLYKEIAQREKAESQLKQSESRYRLLADNSSDVIILHDFKGNVSYVSPSVQSILEYYPWEFQEKNFFDHIHNNDHDQLSIAFERVIKVSGFTRIEHEIIKKDHAPIWVETISKRVEERSITDDNSNLIISVMRDITARKKIEEEVNNQHIELELQNEELLKVQKELEVSYFKYFQLFESAPVGYFNLDPDTKILNANKTVAKIFNLALNELIGKQFTDFVHENSVAAFRAVFNNSLISDEVVREEIRFLKKANNIEEFYALIEIVSIENADNKNKHLQMALMDISERYKAELKLSESEKQLRLANNAKDRFFSIIAHDLKSPFFGVLGLLDHILQNKDSIAHEEVIQICGLVHDAVKQQFNLTEDLLFWARSNTGRLKVDKAYFELYLAINKTRELLKQNIKEKRIRFFNDVPADMTILADMNLTITILRNLISNAIKFSPEGGEIKVYASVLDGYYNIFVEDHGVGIEKNDMDKLFKLDEVFTTPGTKNEKGTGLGLIICHEFATKQGGTLDVASIAGKGTIFTLKLPVEIIENA
jgi:PAS domain S-box-containing protein